jgi:ubiquinone/menaquinone biosynthesis C-methylase UbiE
VNNPIREFFEAHAATWHERLPPDIVARLSHFAAPFAAQFAAASVILEIGSGTGAFTPMIRSHAPAARLFSLDLAFAMLDEARRRSPAAHLMQADVHRLPLPDAGCDLVICHNSFPHFADKPAALREMGRVLCDGGELLILHNNSREQVNAIHARVGAPIAADTLPTAAEMRRLLTAGGYGKLEVVDAPDHYHARARRL